MTAHAPITGAPTCASISDDIFEDLTAFRTGFDGLRGVIEAAAILHIPEESADPTVGRLLGAAGFMGIALEGIFEGIAGGITTMELENERRQREGR